MTTSTAPTQAAQDGRTGWSLAAAGTVTAVFTLSNTPTPLYVRWQHEWGFSSGTLTVVFAAYMVGLIATLLTAGVLADRHGRKAVLLPGMAAAVASAALFLVASSVLWLLAARFLAGVAVGAAVTAGMAATVDLAGPRRSRIGSLIASASMVLGAGLGPLLAGVIAQFSYAPQTPVFVTVLVIVSIALVVVWLLPLRRPLTEGAARRRWTWPTVPSGNRRHLAWGIATFAPGITATSFVLSLGPTVLASVLGQDSALLAGATACVMFLVATGIQFALAHLTTRSHLALSSIAAIAAMTLLVLTVTAWPSPALFVAVALLAGAAQALGQLAGLTLIATNVPAARRAEGNAALNIAGYIPAALLPVATGYLIDTTGLATAITVFAIVLTTASVVALITIVHRTRTTRDAGR